MSRCGTRLLHTTLDGEHQAWPHLVLQLQCPVSTVPKTIAVSKRSTAKLWLRHEASSVIIIMCFIFYRIDFTFKPRAFWAEHDVHVFGWSGWQRFDQTLEVVIKQCKEIRTYLCGVWHPQRGHEGRDALKDGAGGATVDVSASGVGPSETHWAGTRRQLCRQMINVGAVCWRWG